MNQKLLSLFIIGMFLFSYASIPVGSQTIDQSRDLKSEYKNNDMTFQVRDSTTNELKIEANLTSHKSVDEIKQVGLGNQRVLCYDVDPKQNLQNSLGDLKLTDVETGKSVQRDWKYVYLTNETYESPIYSPQNFTAENGTIIQNFTQTGTENLTREVWKDFNTRDLNEKMEICAEVEVREGDYLDGVISFEGQEAEKHAVWEQSLEADIIAWWGMDESSGDLIDATGNDNTLSESGTVSSQDGIINNSRGTYSTSNFFRNNSGVLDLNQDVDYSISLWVYPTETWSSTSQRILFAGGVQGDLNDYSFNILHHGSEANNTIRFNIDKFAVGSAYEFNSGEILVQEWTHIVATYDGATRNISIYLNNSLINTSIVNSQTYDTRGGFSIGIREGTAIPLLDGYVDEVGYWNRVLTPEEVQILYSDGNGCTYQLCIQGLDVSLLSPTNNTNFTTSEINFIVSLSKGVEDLGAENLTIESWNTDSDTLAYTETNTSGFFANYTFTNTFSDGNYNQTAYAWGNDSVRYDSSDTIFFTVDATPPTISLPHYTNGTLIKNSSLLTLNISVSDLTSGLSGSHCIVDVNGTNQSLGAVSSGWCNSSSIALTNLLDGNHTINVYVNDSFGNLGLNDSYVVFVDSNSPNQTINTPSGVQSSLTVPYNVSLSEVSSFDFCTAWVTRGAAEEVANTTQVCPNGTSGDVSGNIVVSGEANYIFHFFSNDTLGNSEYSNSSFSVSLASGSSGGGGGGSPSINQIIESLGLNQESVEVCMPFKAEFLEVWANNPNNLSGWERFKEIYQSLLQYGLCGSAASIVPL